ncbi:hypothetical protein BCR21_15630 [Enterococcus ureasiticus]|uniref:Sensor histidine kinase NatK-like C-terminal domain-containing protein n=1 Tax=Enterococcus ureasiticus TaxID=903984 RepID=A0A1E5G8G3_9ENTE|nr:hypothetical protein BCR21_15630 [Enterococcus ureasiticus]
MVKEALSVLVLLQFIVGYICVGLIAGKINKSFFRIVAVLLLGGLGGFLYQLIGVYGALYLLCGNFILAYIDLKKFIPVMGSLGIAMIFNLLFDHVASMIDIFLGVPSNFSPMVYILIHQGIVFILSTIFCILARKLLLRRLPQGLASKEGHVVSLLCFFTYAVYLVCIFLGVGLGNTIQLIQLNLLFFSMYLVFMLVSFSFYSRSLRKEYQVKEKEVEYQAMHRYTSEIETQYAQMRKFRHDYQNILSSLDSYIEEKDLSGLSEYYRSTLQRSSKSISENNFKLDDLSKIEVKAVKSLLASKLIYAQEQGLDASFEASERVTEIWLDPLILVRVLGIFLDNAIEELDRLGSGSLKTAVIKYPNSVQIIVENTCGEKVGHYRELRQAGYSTKGEGRGLGLSNVDELLGSASNTTLETVIEKERFTQILYISEIEE